MVSPGGGRADYRVMLGRGMKPAEVRRANQRAVMLSAQTAMLVVSSVLTVLAYVGTITPWMLLGFTFLINCGAALYQPAWQSSVEEQVPRSELSAVVSLNGVSVNLARTAGPAIGARARAKLSAAPSPSTILDLCKGDISTVTSELVGQAYAAGDPLASEILQESVELLTIWLGNTVDLLDPDVIVMGGGVAAMLKPFFGEIKNRLPRWCVNPRASEIPLFMAHYGADAGIAGGAALCVPDLR